MIKQALVEALADKTKLSKRQVESFIKNLTQIVGESIKRGEKVTITGFGTFDRGVRVSRKGVNPHTGQPMVIPEVIVPKFRAGAKLKKAVR